MTTNSVSHNRTLFLLDNLPVLRGLDSDSVDMIATDPPFNKGVGAFEGTTKAGENVEFSDVWHWGDVQDGWTESIEEDHPSLLNVIWYANAAAGDDMGAFLCWMAVRVLEMHRVLKPTGSMYLHCDPTASHYLKAMMDAVFGRQNFRNEIVWCYSSTSQAKRWFPKKHDTILLYSKGTDWVFNPDDPVLREPYKLERMPKRINDPARNRGGSGQWRGATDDELDERYSIGKLIPDWWEITFGPNSPERTGWPTQKPLKLYKRMIAASSNPGDIVLDPFAGCATTAVAAEQLGRQWIGIDIREESGGDPRTSGARGLCEYGVGFDCADADGSPRTDGRREACGPRADTGISEAGWASDTDPRSERQADNQGRPAVPGLRVGAAVARLSAG